MPGPSALLLATCLTAVSVSPSATTPPQDSAHLTVTRSLQQLSESAGVERFRLGISHAGREIEGLRFASGEVPPNRPAVLVIGNISGLRPEAGDVALALGERLAGGSDEARALLTVATVYVIPEPNPDAAALASASPLIEGAATGTGRDTDRDGLVGEDPPADVDGDGLVTWMRVPDPDGTWIADPKDPRVNVEADAGHAERGLWRIVREGFDSDGDGEASEDAARDAEVNRNFPAGFEQHTAAGGLFAGDEPEARALMDFVLEHPELAVVITIDDQDTLVSAPETADDPATGGGRFFFGPRELPDGKVLESDAAVLAELGRRFQETAKDAPKADSMQAGSFQRWCYEQRGILTLDSPLWVMPTEAPKAEEDAADGDETSAETDKSGAEDDEGSADEAAASADTDDEDAVDEDTGEPSGAASRPAATDDESGDEEDDDGNWRKDSDEVGRLAWVDATDEAWRFIDWHAFEHPQLGPVEIGGWAPYAKLRPPLDVVERVTDEQWQLLAGLADALPRVEVAEFTAEDLGRGLWRIEARIENPALLPLATRAAMRARTSTRARIQLVLPDGASLVAGRTPEFVGRLDGLGRSGEDAEFTWLVQTKKTEGVKLEVTTRSAGEAHATVTKQEAR